MFSIIFWLFLSTTWTLSRVSAGKDCAPRQYGASSMVCVCNATYCDSREPIAEQHVTGGSCLLYTSTKAGLRLSPSLHTFNATGGEGKAVTLHVDRSSKHQEMIGYGGALTDSTAINIHSLSEEAGELLLQSYFGESGSRYSLVRVPMGASDFSTEYYSYDDVAGDTELKHFALRPLEDYRLKIPYLKRIRTMTGGRLKLFTCPWSAPYWMKDNGTAFGRSALRLENYQPWAEYFARYLEEYARNNVTFWGLTPQNEPNQGGVHRVHIISMGWTAKQQRRWIAEHLGPTLQRRGLLPGIKLMVYDDSGLYLPRYLESILKSNVTRNFASGVAIHAYHDDTLNPEIVASLVKQYPDLFFLYTEGAYLRQIQLQTLGSWEVGEYYGKSLFLSANNGVAGWTDWNLALDPSGGPVWSDIPYNAPVIVNSTADEFYKQPSYYFLAHFSGFVPPGSRRVGLSGASGELRAVAFLAPNNTTVVNLMNLSNKTLTTTVSDKEKGRVTLSLQARSIHTLLYK
ncbi:lysosomal acid glucosylceramidase-like [Bacillus rossius redtenbacheri]|uniref:lysosomal acid glucosylceramidase-like n=1 Tax=Bacillus rossius redtenbacheri TaxID=93214 RepID=UPI002FDC9CD5